jgi:uncharacterized protein YndB with AHSA1/START domain
MSTAPAQHDTFVIERRLASPPARVFAAFAHQNEKARWFGCVEGWEVAEHTLDFRVGGREVWRGGPPGATPHRNDTYYHDIVPDERIVFTYDLSFGGSLVSVSLATVEFRPADGGSGAQLTYTEHGAFLDGLDDPELRKNGTGGMLDELGQWLERQAATA